MSLLKPPLRSHDRSILKYVGRLGPACVDHEMGVWSDSARGREVTSASGNRSSSSMEHRNLSNRDWEVGPLHVNLRSEGPISAKTSRNWADLGSRPPAPFGRSAAASVTLKSPPMSMGVSGKAPHSWTRFSHSSPRRVVIEGPYTEAVTKVEPSILFTRRAATTCRLSHVSARSKVASFQANMMPPDRPDAAMATYDSPLPQPSEVHVR